MARKEDSPRPRGKSTRAIHAALDKTIHGEVSIPIFESSTFSFPSAEEGAERFSGAKPGYLYTRMGNPTVNALEQTVNQLENGFAGIATASGMAATTSVYLSLLGQNEHIVESEVVYGPSRIVLETHLSRFGVHSTFVDTSDLRKTEAAQRENTRLVFIETPSNPTLSITDIKGTAEIAHRHGALLVVDNTMAGPYLQRPLDHGADIVIHSLTKYLNGHSDVIGGMIVSASQEIYKRIRKTVNLFGGVMDPLQAWLILRGVRTLGVRMERSQENAMRLAEFLKDHPKVAWVRYPGTADHPQHEIARKQMDGFGAMISFGVVNGLRGGMTFLNGLQLITRAVSLGGIESLIEHPASMTHAAIPLEERARVGISDELIRFSVGCEDFEDLREDLDQALSKIN
ncbi:MAG: methionine gamma-lyase [Deltaproteobacteria bacterium HGW-Deltaproteobacteria-15]|nr:MAG: methionine gamma-lyase [Deltaproteobacteria bacterium HGW-Deltaproteobacteria-15]